MRLSAVNGYVFHVRALMWGRSSLLGAFKGELSTPYSAAPGARRRKPDLDLRATERRAVDAHVTARGLGHAARDVEPEAGRAAAAGAAPQRGVGVVDARAGVGDEDDHPADPLVQRRHERRALGGVPEYVAEQGVQYGAQH